MNPTNQPPAHQPSTRPMPTQQSMYPHQPGQPLQSQPQQPHQPQSVQHVQPLPQPQTSQQGRAVKPSQHPGVATREQVRPLVEETQEQKIEHVADVVKSSQQVLYEASSVFPFQLFPDTITIDREKVSIVKRTFFRVGEVIGVHIDDIMNIAANAGPFLGSLKITLRFVNQEPIEVHYLSRKDALNIKSILQGYVIARQNGIDCTSIEKPQLMSILHRLGSGQAGAASM